MRTLAYASMFAGIGGFEAGFQRAGMTLTAQCEWDAHCRTVLARHYPETNTLGDITDVHGSQLGHPDVMAGGFPCQDTSIAAPHRAGLAGKRSGHFHEFTRLIGEYQRVVDDAAPRWVVIENPTGLLKSNDGRDMSTVVGSLEELGYGWAYRVVDARQHGSPQRRERVIVVGHRGGDPRPAWAVLGDPSASGETRGTRPVGRAPLGPVPTGSPGVTVWRKSARPRASLAKGGYETWVADGMANTLTGFDAGGATRQTHLIAQHGRVRTLTLTEWERLQGFPDGWTAGIPDSARYTALGNAMHVGTAAWLGARLVAVSDALTAIGGAATR